MHPKIPFLAAGTAALGPRSSISWRSATTTGWGGRDPREVSLAPCGGNIFLELCVADCEHAVVSFWTLRITTLHDSLRCLPY